MVSYIGTDFADAHYLVSCDADGVQKTVDVPELK